MLELEKLLTDQYHILPEQIDYARGRAGDNGLQLIEVLLKDRCLSATNYIALLKLLGIEAINIEKHAIKPGLTKLIPRELAWQLKLIPLAFDKTTGTIKAACTNPSNQELKNRLLEIEQIKAVHLVAAVGSHLDVRIIDYYRDEIIPEVPSDETNLSNENDNTEIKQHRNPRKVLVVTESIDEIAAILQPFVNGKLSITLVSSQEEANELFEQPRWNDLLIHSESPIKYKELCDRFRCEFPKGRIKYFENGDELLLGDGRESELSDLVVNNLELFSSLLVQDDKFADSNARKVGLYVEKLCALLGLASADRAIITNAAHLHDFSRLFFGETDFRKWERSLIALSAGRLEAREFNPAVTNVLRAMYKEIDESMGEQLPFSYLGGNIITVVDYFFDNWPDNEKLTLDQFSEIKQSLRSQIGKMFLRNIVEGFLALLRQEVVTLANVGPSCRVVVLTESQEDRLILVHCLENLGFDLVIAKDIEECATICKENKPDMLVLQKRGSTDEITAFVEKAIRLEIQLSRIPTFMMTTPEAAPKLTRLLTFGLEDIVGVENDLDPLLVKISRLRSRIQVESNRRTEVMQQIGTNGTLNDMNTIDLIQAMGLSGKTIRISITGAGKHLIMFMNHGNIVYAECDDLLGVDAVYVGIAWTKGIWSVEPADDSDLPEANIFQSNDAILIEGVHRMDEKILGKPDIIVDDPPVVSDDIFFS